MWSATTAPLVLVKKQGTGKKHFAFLLTSWSSAWILVASGWKVKAGRWLSWSKFDPWKRFDKCEAWNHEDIFVSNTSLSCGETWVSWDGYEYEWSTVMIAWFQTHTSYRTPVFHKSHKPPYCFKSHLQICLRKVTTITFNSAMSACEKNNKHSAVQKLFLMMHQHKVEPDRPPVDVFSLMFFGFFPQILMCFYQHAEASSNSNVQHGNMCKFTTKHTNIMEAVTYLTVRSGWSAKVVLIKNQVRDLIGESDLINTLTARITHNVAISACQAGLKFGHVIRSMIGKYDV